MFGEHSRSLCTWQSRAAGEEAWLPRKHRGGEAGWGEAAMLGLSAILCLGSSFILLSLVSYASVENYSEKGLKAVSSISPSFILPAM